MITVFGLGKLGLPLAASFAAQGLAVIGVDPNAARRTLRVDWHEPGLKELLAQGQLHATHDPVAAVRASSAAFIIVPTPSDERGAFSNQYVLSAVEAIGGAVGERPYDIVVVSTVMPGSMGGEIRQTLERSAARPLSSTLRLSYSPQLIALGSVVQNLREPDLVLIGEQVPGAAATVEALFAKIHAGTRPVHRLPWVGAELAKMAINSFVTAKLSFANWLGQMAEAHAVDPAGVLAAVGADARIGSRYLGYGMPYGGPCFPRDNVALALASEAVGLPSDFPRSTHRLNQAHQERLLALAIEKARGGKVAILGLAYKAGTEVTEEASGLRLAQALHDLGHPLVVHDALVKQAVFAQAATVEEAVEGAHVVVIATTAYRNVATAAFVINPWGA